MDKVGEQVRLHFTASKAEADRIFPALEAVFEEDGLPLAVLELDEERDIHEVSVYAMDDAEDVENRIRDVLAGLSLPRAVEREILPDIDWVSLSLEGLKPVRAGGFFVHGAHDRDKVEPGDIAIEIEAGLAFGTGHHGTTAGCLEMIAEVVEEEKPASALDLGTGSAVLAIAMAKLAHIPVLATDIDPVATEVAEANARLNGVADLIVLLGVAALEHEPVRKALDTGCLPNAYRPVLLWMGVFAGLGIAEARDDRARHPVPLHPAIAARVILPMRPLHPARQQSERKITPILPRL